MNEEKTGADKTEIEEEIVAVDGDAANDLIVDSASIAAEAAELAKDTRSFLADAEQALKGEGEENPVTVDAETARMLVDESAEIADWAKDLAQRAASLDGQAKYVLEEDEDRSVDDCKVVDALFLVAFACEKMRVAHHASSLCIRLCVPDTEDKPVAAIEAYHGSECIGLGRFTLEAAADKLLKGSVCEIPRGFKRQELGRG